MTHLHTWGNGLVIIVGRAKKFFGVTVLVADQILKFGDRKLRFGGLIS